MKTKLAKSDKKNLAFLLNHYNCGKVKIRYSSKKAKIVFTSESYTDNAIMFIAEDSEHTIGIRITKISPFSAVAVPYESDQLIQRQKNLDAADIKYTATQKTELTYWLFHNTNGFKKIKNDCIYFDSEGHLFDALSLTKRFVGQLVKSSSPLMMFCGHYWVTFAYFVPDNRITDENDIIEELLGV